MEQRTDSPYPRLDRPVLAVIGVLLVISTVLFAYSDRKHDWRYYQWEFRRQVVEKFGAEKARTVPSGMQQVWVPSLGRADRCETCHQAVHWKGFEQGDEPFRTHLADPLKAHPSEKFGCTACHGGQGWAVDVEAAHGAVEHWEAPLLGKELGEAYSIVDDKAALIQINCNVCHRYDRETQGADFVNLGKKLVQEKGCRACHVINGRGGTIGPDLTYVGDKAPEQYEFGRLSGQKTSFAWHVAHLKDPRALVQDTVMPNFHLTTKEAQALAIEDRDVGAGALCGGALEDAGAQRRAGRLWLGRVHQHVCHRPKPVQLSPTDGTARAQVLFERPRLSGAERAEGMEGRGFAGGVERVLNGHIRFLRLDSRASRPSGRAARASGSFPAGCVS